MIEDRHRAMRRGDLRHLLPGVFQSTSHPDDRQSRMVAACMVSPAVAIAATSAGELWGMRNMTRSAIHVLLPHGVRLQLPGYVVHRSRHVDAVDLAFPRHDGIVLTSPPRTIIDAAPWIGCSAVEGVIEQALADRRCTLGTIADTVARLAHPNHHGAVIVRSVLAGRPAWRRAARSELEIRVRRAIEARGLNQPLINHKVIIGGQRFMVDVAWPALRLCVEIDHPYWHDREEEARDDKQRDRTLGIAGWFTARLPQWDIEHRLEAALDDVAALIEARRRDIA